jgi:hypothetical protein
MLDVKIGEKTAAAAWHGKSSFGAWRARVVDSLTNTVNEGFRLEGVDGPPPNLKSMDPSILGLLKRKSALHKKVSVHGSQCYAFLLVNQISVSKITSTRFLVVFHRFP